MIRSRKPLASGAGSTPEATSPHRLPTVWRWTAPPPSVAVPVSASEGRGWHDHRARRQRSPGRRSALTVGPTSDLDTGHGTARRPPGRRGRRIPEWRRGGYRYVGRRCASRGGTPRWPLARMRRPNTGRAGLGRDRRPAVADPPKPRRPLAHLHRRRWPSADDAHTQRWTTTLPSMTYGSTAVSGYG